MYILESLYIYELCIKEDFGTPSGVCAFGGRIYTQERKKESGGSTGDLGLLTSHFKDKLFHSRGDIAEKLVFAFVCT